MEELIKFLIKNGVLFKKFIQGRFLTNEEQWLLAGQSILLLIILCRIGLWLYLKWEKRKLISDLEPFYSKNEVLSATKYFVPTRVQNVPPSNEIEPRNNFFFTTSEKLIPFFINKAFRKGKDDQKYYLVLADSGMGKTTFIINLYLTYLRQWFRKKYKMVIIPLGHPKAWESLQQFTEKEARNTILLLDAFDEDQAALDDYQKRLNEIIDKVWAFREVVITSRTQFFPNQEREPNEIKIKKVGGEGGYHRFAKMYISPFSDDDIDRYLKNKYGRFNNKKKKKAKNIVKNAPNLLVRPMLLNYIDDLLGVEVDFKHTYQIYEALIDKWIDREADRVPIDSRESFRTELYRFSKEIALDMYFNRDGRKGIYLTSEEIAVFAKKHTIQLKDLEMKSRSLLNRDADGKYKFSHKSIFEYFLALEAGNSPKIERQIDFNEGLSIGRVFLNEIVIDKHLPVLAAIEKNKATFSPHREATSITNYLDYDTLTRDNVYSNSIGFYINDLNGFHIGYLKYLDNLDRIFINSINYSSCLETIYSIALLSYNLEDHADQEYLFSNKGLVLENIAGSINFNRIKNLMLWINKLPSRYHVIQEIKKHSSEFYNLNGFFLFKNLNKIENILILGEYNGIKISAHISSKISYQLSLIIKSLDEQNLGTVMFIGKELSLKVISHFIIQLLDLLYEDKHMAFSTEYHNLLTILSNNGLKSIIDQMYILQLDLYKKLNEEVNTYTYNQIYSTMVYLQDMSSLQKSLPDCDIIY